jgi:pSer/pThr/pTyr-binding forkhead associated (FHA) protein/soluble lytic murein transglycosylase-like protein
MAGETAWLVRKSEAAATRYAIRGELTRIGRSGDNDIVLDDPRVSSHHAEILFVDGVYRLRDLDSTNGTYISGERVSETTLVPPVSFQLGNSGPELHFLLEIATSDPNETVLATVPPPMPDRSSGILPSISEEQEQLLSRAVARARRARHSGAFDQTATIMRVMLKEALGRSSRKFKIMIAVLVFALGGVSAYGAIEVRKLTAEKRMLDAQMQKIEIRLEQSGQEPRETQQLLDRLDEFQSQEKQLESAVLYRIAPGRQDPVIRGIRTLMAEFGAETYSIPPEFLDAVNRFIARYRGPDRATTEHALGDARPNVEAMREVFEQEHLPPDLAYMAVAESGMRAEETSIAGAVGWWQFTPVTAAHFGLRVYGQVDERRDVRKSTQAAAKYIRELILDFGTGSSVMLALAAYDLGPAKVKQAIRRVSDPIRQRNFWYLYRTRALPPETRDYVPKVIAAMIIARHPEQFGF